MRILALQDFLRVGGTETQLLTLASEWRKLGHEVVVGCFRRGGGLEPWARELGLDVRFLQPVGTPFSWWSPGLGRLLLAHRPDGIFLFGRNANSALSRVRGVDWSRVVATVRTARALPSRYRSTLRRASLVLANSRFAADRAVAAGVVASRIRVIPNACRLGLAPAGGLEVPDTIPAEAKVLLAVSSFLPGKRPLFLLRALEPILAENPGWIVLWAGDGPLRGEAESFARGSPVGSKIRFLGNRSDLAPLYERADLLVHASVEESLPNAVVEAAWCGTPAVACRCAGLGEIIREGRTGRLVEPEDIEGFRTAVRASLRDPAALAAMGAEARRLARETHDPGRVARAWLESFRQE